MNENIDLKKILENCPHGTKLFSTEYGYVEYLCIDGNAVNYPIIVKGKRECDYSFTKDGYSCKEEYRDKYAEPSLFPAHDQRDWSKFKAPSKKVKVKVTLHPFDKVLARDVPDDIWKACFVEGGFKQVGCYNWRYVIPYNKETAHLIGTTDDCPIDYEIEFSKEFKEE